MSDKQRTVYANCVELITCCATWYFYDIKAATVLFCLLWVISVRTSK